MDQRAPLQLRTLRHFVLIGRAIDVLTCCDRTGIGQRCTVALVEGLVLAGFVEGEDDTLTPRFFLELAESVRVEEWPITPPQSAEEPDAGLVLFLHHPSSVGSESERVDLRAAERLLGLFADASALSDAVIAVEYDGEVIGWVERGKLDDALRLGFLGEWRRLISQS